MASGLCETVRFSNVLRLGTLHSFKDSQANADLRFARRTVRLKLRALLHMCLQLLDMLMSLHLASVIFVF